MSGEGENAAAVLPLMQQMLQQVSSLRDELIQALQRHNAFELQINARLANLEKMCASQSRLRAPAAGLSPNGSSSPAVSSIPDMETNGPNMHEHATSLATESTLLSADDLIKSLATDLRDHSSGGMATFQSMQALNSLVWAYAIPCNFKIISRVQTSSTCD